VTECDVRNTVSGLSATGGRAVHHVEHLPRGAVFLYFQEKTQKSRVKAEKTKIFFQKASSGFGDVSFKERSGRFKA